MCKVRSMFIRKKAGGLKRFLNVTWDEIREAERLGEKGMSFELYDILEEASIYGTELDERVEENIQYVLKREGLLPRGASVLIPAGALHWECPEGESCWYYADFEVFDETGEKILARGSATGSMLMLDEETAQLIDMTVWMPTNYVKKLKSLAMGLKSLIAAIFNPR